MRIHWLQHVPFEGLGSIEKWAYEEAHSLSCTRLYAEEQLPDQTQFDCLIVMGGPMNIYDINNYPWLYDEKQFIKESLSNNKKVLGICLGAQLLADALGSNIKSNGQKEIGWFLVKKTDEFSAIPIASFFPIEALVFHWHGDTFTTPKNAIRIATSEACDNQGFIYKDRVIGLQFHLETTRPSACSLIEHCREDIIETPYIQSEQDMLTDDNRFHTINRIMENILEYMNKL